MLAKTPFYSPKLAKIAEIGKNRRNWPKSPKLAKIAEIDKNRRNWRKSPKLAKIAEYCDHNLDPRRAFFKRTSRHELFLWAQTELGATIGWQEILCWHEF
jgi:hypothetical protein